MFPANPNQLEIIRQLETALNKEIPPKDRIGWTTIGYQTDKNGNIIGLGLYDSGVKTKHLEIINSLTNLTILDLSGNQITEIKNLENLTNLTRLSLPYNQITEIKNLENLTNLTTLYLYNNQITDTTPIKNLILNQKGVVGGPVLEVSSSTDWEVGKVTLGGNPLKTPPMEVVAQGTEAFLRWFEEAALKAKTVKVTLLGNTGAGKSNLVNCLNLMDKTDAEINKTLQNFSASNHSTDVIRIVTKDYEDGVKVYFYDFGGQEHFHGTYNLFLGGGSKGGLVILLVTKKSDRLPFSGKNEDPTDIVFQKPDGTTETRKQSLIRFPPDYWLELIRKKFGYTEISFLEEEVDSNLIIIQNQAKVEGNIGDLTSIKHKYRYKMDLQDPQDFLDEWKKFRLRLQEIIKKDIQEKKVTPTYQVLLELIDEMDPPTPPQPQPSSDPQPKSVKPKITRISLIELYNKLQAKLENTEYKEETNRDEKSKQLSFMDALFLLAIGGRIIFLEWEEIVTDEGKLEYINHRKSTPVFFSPELVTQKIAEILDWHKLVEERRDNHLFTEIGNFKKEEVENIEEIDTYLELLTKQKIIFSYRNKDEETVYVAPQYLPCWKELQVGSKETIEAYKNNVGEENITTLYSNLIEPSFFVKLMSDILQNKSFSPVYRDGFCFTTEGFDITIIKKGQKKKEKPAKLLIYFKKEMGSCPKKEFEKCEIKILEKIKKISRKTNTYFFLEEEGRKKELSDYIEYKEGKIALTELNKRIEKLEEMIKEKGLTVLGDYVEGAKNEFKKDSNPRGVFGDSGEYQENPTKEI